MATSVFAEEPSIHLFCQLCKKLLQDPVISVGCGHTFCRLCLTGGTDEAVLDTCPVDKKALRNTPVVANRAITQQLDDLLVYCKNGIKRFSSRNDELITDVCGCPELVRLSEKLVHEAKCPYSKLQCPNSPECGVLQRLCLEEHILSECRYVRCDFHDKGCAFHGLSPEVKSHTVACLYSQTNQACSKTASSMIPNKEEMMMKELRTLREKVSHLECSHNELKVQLQGCLSVMADMDTKYTNIQSVLDQHQNKLSSASFSRSQRLVMKSRQTSDRHDSSSPETTISSFDHWQVPFEFKCIGTLRGHLAAIHCLATRGHWLYSSGAGKVIKVWDLDALSRGCTQNIKGHTDVVNALLAGSEYLYSGGADQSIRMWKYDTLTEHKYIKNAHDTAICALAKNKRYVFSSGKSTIKVWLSYTLELVQTIPGLNHWVRALVLEPSKEQLYSGSHNALHVWDATGTFTLSKTISHDYGSVHSIAITSQYIIMGTQGEGESVDSLKYASLESNSGTYNRNMQIFDVVTHQHIKSLGGHIGIVTDLATSPAGQFVISSSYDNTVQVWDLKNFLSVQVLSRHQGSVNAITLRNTLLFTGSEDKDIKIFKYLRPITYSSFGNHILPGKDT